MVLLVFMFVGGNGADEHNPAREMFGLRLGMNEKRRTSACASLPRNKGKIRNGGR